MLRAYHYGDAVRRRKQGPESVTTSARMLVRGQPGNEKSRDSSPAAKATQRMREVHSEEPVRFSLR